MISQAYIFGSLGKATFKQDEKWYVLDNNDPDTIRDWHAFDNNYLTLTDIEIIPVAEGKNLDELRQMLVLETQKQEALTLALQLMDTSIQEESLKMEIAGLLGEYSQDAAIFMFLENRLLSTVMPDSFDPSFAGNVCHLLQLKEIGAIYEFLNKHAAEIQLFYTVWVKTTKNYFHDIEKADTAFSILTSHGVARKFIQSIAKQDKYLWDKAIVEAMLLFRAKGLSPDVKFFIELLEKLTENSNGLFQDFVYSGAEVLILQEDNNSISTEYLKLSNKFLQSLTKKTKALLIDDETDSINKIFNILAEYCPHVQIIRIVNTLEEAVQATLHWKPDLVFFDIKRPLNKTSRFADFTWGKIIFTSSFPHFFPKGIQMGTYAYLVKPFNINELIKAVEVTTEKADSLVNQNIVLSNGVEINLLPITNIIYCEADGHHTNVFFFSEGNIKKIAIPTHLSHLELQLTDTLFCRTHRNYIVNLLYVNRYERNGRNGLLYLSQGACIPVSIPQKDYFEEKYLTIM